MEPAPEQEQVSLCGTYNAGALASFNEADVAVVDGGAADGLPFGGTFIVGDFAHVNLLQGVRSGPAT